MHNIKHHVPFFLWFETYLPSINVITHDIPWIIHDHKEILEFYLPVDTISFKNNERNI